MLLASPVLASTSKTTGATPTDASISRIHDNTPGVGRMSASPSKTEPTLNSSMGRLTKPRMTPDRFDGATPWTEYLKHFKSAAMVNAWNDNEKAIFLTSSLRGDALKVLPKTEDWPPSNYHDLVRKLEESFGPSRLADTYLLELRRKRRGDRETLKELGRSIRILAEKAYPEASGLEFERLCKLHLLDAIPDKKIREGVFLASCPTLDRAVQVAMGVECFQQMEEERHGSQGRQPARRIHSLEVAPAPVPAPTPAPVSTQGPHQGPHQGPRQGPPRQCYNCAEIGHLIKSCPHPPRCFNCGGFGHLSRACPSYREPAGPPPQPNQGNGQWPTQGPARRL